MVKSADDMGGAIRRRLSVEGIAVKFADPQNFANDLPARVVLSVLALGVEGPGGRTKTTIRCTQFNWEQ